MFKIYPSSEFAFSCPQDQGSCTVREVLITGMHIVADAQCPVCHAEYYAELPVGHALFYPVILNRSTKSIRASFDISWRSRRMNDSFLSPVSADVVPIVHRFRDCDSIVILNCLDFLYGHSLLKLLTVQQYLDRFPDIGCCVLVPSQLVHLVPDGVAEIWELPVPVRDGWKRYPSLESWIKNRYPSYRACFLAHAYPHPDSRSYDIFRFVKNLPDISKNIRTSEPVILFSYREDRLWGESLEHQERNIRELYAGLSGLYPDMVFVLVGFGKKNSIPADKAGLIDLRTNAFNIATEKLWLAYMQSSDCAIGVHGSNMLLPSGLSKSSIELVPRSRIKNTVQDFLFRETNCSATDVLLFYRMIYGNNSLSDVAVSLIIDIVANMMSTARLTSEFCKAPSRTVEEMRKKISEIRNSGLFARSLNYFEKIK